MLANLFDHSGNRHNLEEEAGRRVDVEMRVLFHLD